MLNEVKHLDALKKILPAGQVRCAQNDKQKSDQSIQYTWIPAFAGMTFGMRLLRRLRSSQ